MTAATQTVREIAQTQPTSIRVFEKFGINIAVEDVSRSPRRALQRTLTSNSYRRTRSGFSQ